MSLAPTTADAPAIDPGCLPSKRSDRVQSSGLRSGLAGESGLLPPTPYRSVHGKRSVALREFARGLEVLERFICKEPLRRVPECVFGVLALETEPTDPRL